MPSARLIRFAKAISRLLGWIYTLAWSLSFYPQPLLNLRRHSTVGTTVAFPAINVLGFIAYLTNTSCLYFSPLIRSQYAARNPISPEPTVRLNDVAFGVHAVMLSTLTWSMFWRWAWGFEQGSGRVSRWVLGVGAGCILGVFWVIGLVWTKGRDGGRDPMTWAWIDVVYATGYTKLLISLVKFLPQIHTNHVRRSTVGWSISQVLLDLLGGILSLAQLFIDSSLQNDWSGIAGNPLKFGLGNISLVIDAVFMLQHYVLYRGGGGDEERGVKIGEEGERRVLLEGEEGFRGPRY